MNVIIEYVSTIEIQGEKVNTKKNRNFTSSKI